ncbi:MAG TPA: N-acetylneuraminate synthase [Burkholderiales bacterium]|nr:N-acetylneuraminate synthase [Burkholderiales bacterium]
MPADTALHVFVIAEAGVNHNGSPELAMRLVDVAAEAGADAIKFQSFRADSLVGRSAPRAEYQKRNQPGEISQHDMLKKLELSEAVQRELNERSRSRGIEFMSSPFDADSLDFLASGIGVKRIKIGSGEITNAPLLLRAARTGLPLILSTGMSTLKEVEAALGVLALGYTGPSAAPGEAAFRAAYVSAAGRGALREKVSLLHCTSEYPAPANEINLRAMDTLRETFGLPTGFSDHSAGIAAAIAAAARGAVIVEKHYTLDRAMPGPDHKASLEPAQLAEMISSIRVASAALGSASKEPAPSELGNRAIARRSLVAARDIRKGERFSAADIAVKRPGGGISPMSYWDWVGKVAERDYRKDDLL